jgi:hypothetical protein
LHVPRSGPPSDIGHVAHIGRIAHIGHILRRGQIGRTVLLALLLGCAADPVAVPVDGGQPAPVCSGSVTCDGLLLRACNDGVPGEQKGDCMSEGACSGGRCMSAPCLAAERDQTSFAGCLFYTAEVDNVASEDALTTSLLVTNPGLEPAVAVLQQPGSDGTWVPIAEAPIAVGKSARLLVPGGHEAVRSGLLAAAALRVWSNQPVTVAQIQSDDTGETARSSGGTMLLPVHVLGSHYLVMTYPQAGTAAVAATAGGAGGAGRMIIVGTQARTGVTIRSSTSDVVGGPVAPDAGAELMIGDGDVLQAWTDRDGADLSGTEIVTTHPVAVFSGNITTTYGKTAAGIHSPDMAHEQLPPVYIWSRKYVAAALPPQAGVCDPLLGPPGASIWRLLAAYPGTRVEFTGPAGTPPVHGPVTLAAGEVLEVITTGDFVVTASDALLMTQGIDCEPSLSLAISADRLLEDVTFAVLPSFDQLIAVARMHSDLVGFELEQPESVLLDGDPIDEALFLPAGGGYEVAHVPLPPCRDDQVCTHRLQGRFGMTLRGMDVLASYALTAPSWGTCLDITQSSCIP